MERSLERQKPSCNDDDLAKMTTFTEDFGQEGWTEDRRTLFLPLWWWDEMTSCCVPERSSFEPNMNGRRIHSRIHFVFKPVPVCELYTSLILVLVAKGSSVTVIYWQGCAPIEAHATQYAFLVRQILTYSRGGNLVPPSHVCQNEDENYNEKEVNCQSIGQFNCKNFRLIIMKIPVSRDLNCSTKNHLEI